MSAPDTDPYQFLLGLLFRLVPKAKTLDDLPKLEAQAQNIIHKMAGQAQHGIDPPAGSEETFAKLRQQLDAVIDEIARLQDISSSLRMSIDSGKPDTWWYIIAGLLGRHYDMWETVIDKAYEARIKAAIREAFFDTSAT